MLGIVFVASPSASADPTPGELEQQIDVAWNRLEPIIEQHNATKAQLAVNRAKADALAKQIAPLALQVDLAMSKVSALAEAYYKGGQTSAVNALLSSGSPTAFATQLDLLDQVARVQAEEVSAVVKARLAYEKQKKPYDDLIAQLAATEAQQAASEKQINAEIANLQVLRLKAYGTTGGTGVLRPVLCPLTYPGGKAGIAVNFACSQIGKPYVWAADGPNSYDCSGLVMAAWLKAGISMPHNALAQKRSIPAVSRANLRPGDLVFYYPDVHHVGMYVGGDWIVHAPTSGDVVRMRKMDHAYIAGYGRPGG